jgi:NADH-quinone oxidoreductase subunit N
VAAITMIVGNAGALGQTSLKRMLGYSGVAQAGYMLGGVIVGTQLGIQATVLYLFVYLAMNMAAFAVIVSEEFENPAGDDISALAGLGGRNPWLAWPMTISMLALAGIPGTVGFIGKFQLIHALVDGGYTWLAIVLVIGSMISLGYYLRVIAAMWMRGGVTVPAPRRLAPIAGASPETDEEEDPGAARAPHEDADTAETRGGATPGKPETDDPPGPVPGGLAPAPNETDQPGEVRHPFHPETVFVAVVSAAASVFFGIVPGPLFDFAAHAGHAISGLF